MPQDNPSAQTATQIKKPLWQRIRYDRLALALSLVFISSFLLYKLSDALIHLPSEKYELAPDNALLYINSNNPASLIDSLQPYQYIPFVHTYSNQLHGIRSLILSKANPFSNKKGILSACFVNPDGQFSILHIIHTSYLFHRDAIKNTVPKYQNPEHLEKRNYKGSIVYEVRLPEDTGVWCFTSIHGHMLISRDPFMIDNYLLRKSKVISKTAAFSSIPSSILKQQVTLILQIPNLQSVQNLATSPVLKRTLSQLSAPNALFAADIQFSEGNILCNGKWIPQSRQLQTIQRILHKHANPKSILACIPADVSLIQSFSIEDPDAFMNDIPSNSTTGKQFFDEWISGNWAFCKLQEDDIFILESKNPELSRKHLSEISKLLPDDSLYYKTSAFNPSQLHNPEFINQTFSNSFFSIKPAFYFSVNNVFYFYSKKSTAQAILESLSNNNVLLNHPNFNEAYRSQTQSANYFIYFNPSITGSWWGNAASTFDSTFFSVSQQLSPFCLSVSNQNGYASAMLRLGPIKSSHSAGNTLWKHTCNAQIISRIFTLSSSSGNEFIKPIELELKSRNFQFEIYGRPKSIHSIHNKIKNKGVSFEEVYDLFAIRIIMHSSQEAEKSDCWAAYSVITDVYRPQPERLRDWISTPKANGYEALHTTVMGPAGRWVEVQIRSSRMHEVAEKGLAAHWKYKEGSYDNALDEWIDRIRETLANPATNALDFITDFRHELFNDEIFVFTPKGELKRLKAGTTALDFAFEIHSAIGLHCIGAKVNHKIVPLSAKLQNGDQVEILTSSKQKPNEDWLKFVVTGKAVTHIRKALHEEKKKLSEEGKLTFEKRMKQYDIPLSEANISAICKFYKYESPSELYYSIASKQLTLSDVKNLELVAGRIILPKPKNESNLSIEERIKQQLKKNAELLIMGESADKIDYKFAACCNPIPGDDVFGFITVSEGIKIHRTNCPNAVQLMSKFDYRIVKTKWNKEHEIDFLTGIKITGFDEVGVINNLTNIITGKLKINMRSLSFDTDDGIFEGSIMVYVHNTEQLEELIEELKTLNGVLSVSRISENEEEMKNII